MANLFSFNAQTETPQMLAERRARAEAIARSLGGSQTLGGGIGDLIAGLGAGLSRYRGDRAQREGEASGRSSMDELMAILSRPPGQPLSTPSDDTVRSGLKTGLATGQVPSLATYTPGGPQNAGMPDTRPGAPPAPPAPPPQMAEAPPEMAPGVQPAGYQPAPMQASPDAELIPKLLQILRNPWVSPADKAIVQERYNDIMRRMSPEYQDERKKSKLDIAKAEIELKKLQNPGTEWEQWTNPKTGELWIFDKKDPAGTKRKIVSMDDVGKEPGKESDAIAIGEKMLASDASANLAAQLPMLKSLGRDIDNNDPGADMNFIYGVAKALDPTGRVTDSDAEMVIATAGVGQAIRGAIAKALKGQGTLSRGQRIQLYRLVQNRAEQNYVAAQQERALAQRRLELGNHDPAYLPDPFRMPINRDQANPTVPEFMGPQAAASASAAGEMYTPADAANYPRMPVTYDIHGRRIGFAAQ